MIQRPSPFVSSTLRLVGVVVMAQVLAIAVVAPYVVPPPAASTSALEEKADQFERDARGLVGELQRGEIDLEGFARELREIGIHPGFLVVATLQGAAALAGAATLMLLAGLSAFGVRIKPRGNWAPGTPWLPLDGLEAILFFGCCQVVLSVFLAVFLRVGAAARVEDLRPEHLAVMYAVAAVATLALLSRRTPGGLPRLWGAVRARLSPLVLRVVQGTAGYAVALPLLVGSRFINPLAEDPFSSNPVISMLLQPQSLLGWILVFAVIGVCAPVFEELLFRGCAYPAFRRRWGAVVAILVNGLLFGAIHGQLPLLVPLSVLGIVFATLYELTGSLVPCIIAHSAQNSLSLLYVMWLNA